MPICRINSLTEEIIDANEVLSEIVDAFLDVVISDGYHEIPEVFLECRAIDWPKSQRWEIANNRITQTLKVCINKYVYEIDYYNSDADDCILDLSKLQLQIDASMKYAVDSLALEEISA